MSGTRAFRVAATGARLVTGIVVAAACAVGVVAAVHAPWPTVEGTPAQVDVTPLPGDSVLVCNGDFRALGRDPNAPLEMRSAGAPSLTADGTAGAPTRSALTAPDLVDGGEVPVLTGTVEGRSAPLVAGAESRTLDADDLAGYAALPCGVPRLESWLVGGSVGTGTEDLVLLANAGEVPATVTLSVYGTTRSARTVVVAPGTQVGLPLASIAAGNEAPVVEVTAVGAPVRAVLQSSLVQVLDPSGVDLQDAVGGAQQNVVLTGVQAFPVDGDEADTTVLRMLAPDADARARVRVLPADGGAAPEEFLVPLTAEEPAQVSLSGLQPGRYTVEIEAEGPIVAAVRQQDGAGRDTDFAWVTPAPELDGEVLVAVPAGPSPRLQIVNTSEQESVVTVEPVEGGAVQELRIPAGATEVIAVAARTSYRLTASSAVHAAVTLTASGAMAVLPVQPGPGVEQAITVYP